jgi:hypothetical protein
LSTATVALSVPDGRRYHAMVEHQNHPLDSAALMQSLKQRFVGTRVEVALDSGGSAGACTIGFIIGNPVPQRSFLRGKSYDPSSFRPNLEDESSLRQAVADAASHFIHQCVTEFEANRGSAAAAASATAHGT